ncbi:MAG: hypothetical protein EA428_02245 [Spirochaetaceae bacterium]|nr:MAG: hypothetical protein EA428_02245 [Spirochaetaceae bacterium]
MKNLRSFPRILVGATLCISVLLLLILNSCDSPAPEASAPAPEASTDESSTEAPAPAPEAAAEEPALRTELQFDLRPVVAELDMDQSAPVLRFEYDYRRPPELETPDAKPVVHAAQVELRGASEVVRYVLGFNPGRNTVHLHLHDLSEPVQEVRITNSEAEFRFLSAELIALPLELSRPDSAEPIPADLGQILDYPQRRWRRAEFEFFSWSAYPEIYVIDFNRLAHQSAFFKRLAFFVEKDEFRGTLLTNAELEGKHGWNAHNYSGSGLADFFNAATSQNFPLNPEEELLRSLMLERGVILRASDGSYAAGPGGVISFSRELPHLRRVFLTHEAMHGLFYMEEEFRDYSFSYWNALTAEERRFWRSFFQFRDFDPEDEYLMVNEFQAYLLQQEPERATTYFTNTWVWRLREAQPEDAAWVNELLRNKPDMFSRPAHDLNRVLWWNSGFRGGDVLRLRRLAD